LSGTAERYARNRSPAGRYPSPTVLKLGIVTPVVTLLPRAHARWEETATVDDVVAVVQEAERLGYHHCTCSEHVAIPTEVAATRGGRYWDPLATLGYLAAVTSVVRLASHVVVLGYHHPLAIAKRYGTLDLVSGGRLVLGVGVGSLEEEFDLLGADFAGRGARADDAIRALRAALGPDRRQPRYAGTHYRFEGLLVDPSAVQEHVPIWVGGRTARSLRRAVELADGWAPFGLRTGELEGMLRRARETPAWERRARPLEVVVQNEHPFDAIGEPERVREQLGRYVAIGATAVNVRFAHHSRAHYCEQLAALQSIV
jgi:probable F420-dependent oxidoreductase